jgi:hypothetical protein
MFAIISKAFGLSRPPQEQPLMPRQIDLSGNLVHFAIPENFSQDMPAEDMIESVDLDDAEIYKDYSKFTLIRRWWDFKDSGFFGKGYGTLMMSLYIKKVSETLGLTTLKPMDFIDIIVDDIKKNKPKDADPLSMYAEYFPAYREKWNNNQRWMNYIQDHGEPPQLSMLYAIPLTKKHYLVAEFISAPNDDIGVREFVDNYTEPFIQRIMHSFQVEYTASNPVKQAVMKKDELTLEQMIDARVKQLELSQ